MHKFNPLGNLDGHGGSDASPPGESLRRIEQQYCQNYATDIEALKAKPSLTEVEGFLDGQYQEEMRTPPRDMAVISACAQVGQVIDAAISKGLKTSEVFAALGILTAQYALKTDAQWFLEGFDKQLNLSLNEGGYIAEETVREDVS